MENLHAFNIKYLPATNTKPSRIKIESLRFRQSVTLSKDYQFSSSYEQAEKHLLGNGFNVIGLAETPNGFILLSDTFKPLK
jgi:hypothetical protein